VSAPRGAEQGDSGATRRTRGVRAERRRGSLHMGPLWAAAGSRELAALEPSPTKQCRFLFIQKNSDRLEFDLIKRWPSCAKKI
jgi:hypothetical protein